MHGASLGTMSTDSLVSGYDIFTATLASIPNDALVKPLGMGSRKLRKKNVTAFPIILTDSFTTFRLNCEQQCFSVYFL